MQSNIQIPGISELQTISNNNQNLTKDFVDSRSTSLGSVLSKPLSLFHPLTMLLASTLWAQSSATGVSETKQQLIEKCKSDVRNVEGTNLIYCDYKGDDYKELFMDSQKSLCHYSFRPEAKPGMDRLETIQESTLQRAFYESENPRDLKFVGAIILKHKECFQGEEGRNLYEISLLMNIERVTESLIIASDKFAQEADNFFKAADSFSDDKCSQSYATGYYMYDDSKCNKDYLQYTQIKEKLRSRNFNPDEEPTLLLNYWLTQHRASWCAFTEKDALKILNKSFIVLKDLEDRDSCYGVWHNEIDNMERYSTLSPEHSMVDYLKRKHLDESNKYKFEGESETDTLDSQEYENQVSGEINQCMDEL